MDENETNVDETTTTNEEEQVEEVTETEEEESEQESLEDRIARLEKENHTLKVQKGKIKAKAERVAEAAPADKKFELSNMDILAIAKSDIHDDDIERVTKFAQMEGISVKEALSNDDMQAILERRTEARKVAAASNTGSAKSGTADVSGEKYLQQAASGKLPDAKNLSAMWDAEMKKK